MGAMVADFDQGRFSGAAAKPTRIRFSGGGFHARHGLPYNHAHLSWARDDGTVYTAPRQAIRGRKLPPEATEALRAYTAELNRALSKCIVGYDPGGRAPLPLAP